METDEHASTYMETYGEGPDSKLRHFIGSLINNRETVLDMGCGPGWNFDHFMTFGPSVTYKGKDYSERFVRVSNQRIHPLEVFELGDVRDFQEDDKSWDVVILQDVLEHTNGYEKPLKEALRVARKRIIVTFWHLGDQSQINDDGDDGYGAWYRKENWENYLDSLNLHWMHDEIPRQGDNLHHIYVIDLGELHGIR